METFLWIVLVTAGQGNAERAEELIDRLRSPDIQVREEAHRRLIRSGTSAMPALRAAMSDNEAEVAGRATEILKMLELDASLSPAFRAANPGAAELLAHGSNRLWFETLRRAVGRDPNRTPLKGVQRSDLEVLILQAARAAYEEGERDWTLQVMLRWNLIDALPVAVRWLDESNPLIRRSIAGGINRMDPEYPTDGSHRSCQPGLDDGRSITAQILANARAPASIREILGLLGDEDTRLRRIAAEALGIMKTPAAETPLLHALEDPDPEVRLEAIKALAEVSPALCVGRVRVLLRDADFRVRRTAVEALQALRVREASHDLAPLMADPAWQVRLAASKALVDMGCKDTMPHAISLLRHEDQGVCCSALSVLSGLGAKQSIPSVAALLSDPERLAPAIGTLGELHARDHADRLAPFLRHPDPNVRCIAVRTLSLLGPDRLIPELASLLEDDEEIVRLRSVRAAGALGAAWLVPRLLGMLDDPEMWVRDAAMESLARLAAREAIPALKRIWHGPDGMDRNHAAAALCRFGITDGARRVAQASADPHVLNALRSPEAWARLAATPLEADLEGSRSEILQALARNLGMPIEFVGELGRGERRYDSAFRFISARSGRTTALEVLEKTASARFVLEPGRIRILTWEASRRFWKEWSAGVPAKE